MMTGKLAYLASPYSHADKTIEAQRYEAVIDVYHWLIHNQHEFHFFVPIIQCHPLTLEGRAVPGDWKFWADFDGVMLSRCQELWILAIPGFDKSVGIAAETKIATDLGLPIKYVVPKGDSYEIQTLPPEV